MQRHPTALGVRSPGWAAERPCGRPQILRQPVTLLPPSPASCHQPAWSLQNPATTTWARSPPLAPTCIEPKCS